MKHARSRMNKSGPAAQNEAAFPLRSLSAGELKDDQHSDYDASLLFKQYHDDEETEDDKLEPHALFESTGILQRFMRLMSRSPLLSSRAKGTESYGAVPSSSLSSDEGSDGEDVDDVRRRARRKGKGSALRQQVSPGTDKSRQSRDPSSASKKSWMSRGSGREYLPTVGAELTHGLDGQPVHGLSPVTSEESIKVKYNEGDETIGIKGETSSEHNPPDNSQFPQVRASVSATDDVSLSVSTPRMWILSILFALLGSATNLFFSLRYPSVAITPVIALVLVHPLGLIWDKGLKHVTDPKETFEYGILSSPKLRTGFLEEHRSRRTRLRLWLAQGTWNEKEHACVYIASNVSFGFAFATDVIVEQAKFYHQDPGVVYQLLLTISTQILGYAFAGITRRYLVTPSSMIWPGTLMSTAMFSTLHNSKNATANGWTVTRWRFFQYVWLGAFSWYFLPGLLMPALSYFNVITWFAPDNVVLSNLFGVSSGLGLFPMTFDWAQIAYIGSPLLTPWWAAANVVGGLILIMWIVAPILYYSNVLFSSYMPILSSAVFDDTGKPYDVSKILTSDFQFDHTAYVKYSRIFLPITYVLSYSVQFAGLAALVTHTALYHGADVWNETKKLYTGATGNSTPIYHPINQSTKKMSDQAKSSPRNTSGSLESTEHSTSLASEDVHNRLMQRYADAPISWYLYTFISMLAIGIFVVEYFPQIHLPWYGLLLALCITALLFIPLGIIKALTNQHISLYLICQLICGIIFPGRPVANMVFVTYCYISSAQGIKFSSDLKLGHYMKIPPRILFSVQMVATLVSSVTQIGVLNWMFAYIPGICTPEAINGFICPIALVHYNGSVLWGVVGPARFFGKEALYRHLVWAFPIGAIAPVIIWAIGRRSSNSFWRKINLPVLFGSLSWIPPATGLNFSVWALVCFVFNYVIRRRASAWWGKYTMTLSAALDSGLAFALVVVFFGFIYPGWMDLSWWGTQVYKQGCDWRACSYKTVEPGEHFGPPP
ncbi:hypothetical protein MMC09_000158 [Bachmanniomyces sp. S44760]|nr:hypothetical protein [Bachmanniomyces sp. S44760]